MKSRGIFWTEPVLGFTVFQWPIAGDGKKHESQREKYQAKRKRSGILGNSCLGRQADIWAPCTRALCGLHALCHGFTVEWTSYPIALHFLWGHLPSESHVFSPSILACSASLISQGNCPWEHKVGALTKLWKWPRVSPFASAIPLSAWALCDPMKVSNVTEKLY